MYSEPAKEGCEVVVFQWYNHNGQCYDCGLPAAFKLVGHAAYSKNLDSWKRCCVCAANAAADGEFIERIEPLD